jgi:hypothetical protein
MVTVGILLKIDVISSALSLLSLMHYEHQQSFIGINLFGVVRKDEAIPIVRNGLSDGSAHPDFFYIMHYHNETTSNSTVAVPFGPSAERDQQNALNIISDSIVFDQLMTTLRKSAAVTGNEFSYENEDIHHGYVNAYSVLGIPDTEEVHEALREIYDEGFESSYKPKVAAKTILAGWFKAIMNLSSKGAM